MRKGRPRGGCSTHAHWGGGGQGGVGLQWRRPALRTAPAVQPSPLRVESPRGMWWVDDRGPCPRHHRRRCMHRIYLGSHLYGPCCSFGGLLRSMASVCHVPALSRPVVATALLLSWGALDVHSTAPASRPSLLWDLTPCLARRPHVRRGGGRGMVH